VILVIHGRIGRIEGCEDRIGAVTRTPWSIGQKGISSDMSSFAGLVTGRVGSFG
jgi:hypothetical protein